MAIKASSSGLLNPRAVLHAGNSFLTSACLSTTVSAQDNGLRLSMLTRESGAPIIMDMTGPLGLIFVGLVILTTTTAVLHIVGRQRWSRRLAAQNEEIGALQAKVQQADIFMSGERHVVVAWGNASGEPDIEGDVGLILGAGAPRRILGFSQWLQAVDARKLDGAVEKLKLRGEGFTLAFDGTAGKRLEIDGRAVSGRAVMRVREVSGDRLEKLKAEESYGRLAGEMAALHAVLDAVPQPMWLRYPDGRLAWVNRSFAEAVDCRHPNEVISKGMELVDRPQREKIAAANKDGPFKGRFAAIVSGKRTVVDVCDVTTPFGSGGIANDASEIDLLRIQIEAEMATHVRTLNELPIAVAIFDRKKHLRFNNAAFQKLWGLDAAFLKTLPGDGEILDHLRAERRIQEQSDFKDWKQSMLDGYQKSETAEHLWHLPDGRMLRVVASPTPDGGINYVYDDMTERMTLEAQFKALSRVQNETLDSLKEGVAVFGSDGRLKLANVAFSTIWRLHAEALQDSPHIDEVIRRCPLAAESKTWIALSAAITGLTDSRLGLKLRDIRPDNSVVDCATAPLPDGATLITFADVTANVNAELFLQERNEALETAARMKNEFIKNVSYELRTPLQNVTMATGMLADETVGLLTQKQKEYAEAAQKSADALLSLMNDIFDLASLDAGTLELSSDTVSPMDEIESVSATLADRLAKAKVTLRQDIAADAGCFEGDALRIRQVLYHLVANAIGFSTEGQTIVVSARRDQQHMILSVSDQGRGIPEEALGRVFERFESNTNGSNHRGVGLGLSMVKAFVALHQGQLDLKSAPGEGTTVICRFPLITLPRGSTPSEQQKVA